MCFIILPKFLHWWNIKKNLRVELGTPWCLSWAMCVLAVILSLSHGFKNESEFHSEFQTEFNQNWLFLVEQSKNNKYMKFNTIYCFIPSFLHKNSRFFTIRRRKTYHPPRCLQNRTTDWQGAFLLPLSDLLLEVTCFLLLPCAGPNT